MTIDIRWTDASRMPVEASAIRPDRLAGLDAEAARRLSIQVGNETVDLGELADVAGRCEGNSPRIRIEGDLRRVGGLGSGMAFGSLEIRGDVGPRLGEVMAGGTIELHGNAGDWACAGMMGGRLRVRGSVRHHLGAALPGEPLGMRDGLILVDGDAGDSIGVGMRRGLIAVGGTIGGAAGLELVAGSIFSFGTVGAGAGSGMKRGTIAVLGDRGFVPLPTFLPSGRDLPPFLRLYLKRLVELGFPPARSVSPTGLRRYNGDLAAGGQGEILVAED